MREPDPEGYSCMKNHSADTLAIAAAFALVGRPRFAIAIRV